MANNILAGINFLIAKQTANWATVGLNSGNTIEVYTSNEGSPVSWRPDKTINTLNAGGIVLGKGYQINSKTAMDNQYFFSSEIAGIVTLS